ncbi:hypothetical protein J3R83DRAFT_12717 [Lanmaoa asiatica]|nr:hypothetical protein J3R83DRAFT_12717 [Lanmaoa asiatica]
MPTYTIFPLEPPVSPSQLAAYKALRLTSLQVDRHAFGSNYAREVGSSEDVWRQRLDSPFKQTLIASVLDAASHVRDGDVNEMGDWIGTASIAEPSGTHPFHLGPIQRGRSMCKLGDVRPVCGVGTPCASGQRCWSSVGR